MPSLDWIAKVVGKFAFLNLKNNKIQDEYKLPNYKKIQREFDGTQVWPRLSEINIYEYVFLQWW